MNFPALLAALTNLLKLNRTKNKKSECASQLGGEAAYWWAPIDTNQSLTPVIFLTNLSQVVMFTVIKRSCEHPRNCEGVVRNQFDFEQFINPLVS